MTKELIYLYFGPGEGKHMLWFSTIVAVLNVMALCAIIYGLLR